MDKSTMLAWEGDQRPWTRVQCSPGLERCLRCRFPAQRLGLPRGQDHHLLCFGGRGSCCLSCGELVVLLELRRAHTETLCEPAGVCGFVPGSQGVGLLSRVPLYPLP